MSFIQWNIRSLQANREELNIMLSSHNPIVFSLQETFIGNGDNCVFRNYNFYHKAGTTGTTNRTFHGGVGMLVNSSFPHCRVNLQTDLQAVATRVTCGNRTITICSLYIPPSNLVTAEQLEDLVNQLPPPLMVLGDFNAHSTLWGDNKVDRRGKLVENVILKHNLSLLNDGSKTYFHPGTGTSTAIDLSICSPSIFLDLQWSVGDDLCGSDHAPIFINYNNNINTTAMPSWKLRKADWCAFTNLSTRELASLVPDTSIDDFTASLTQIATETIPTSKPCTRKRNTIWFNDDCKDAILERRKALSKLKHTISAEHLNEYKIVRAKARRTIKNVRRQSWQRFVSSINSRTSIKKVWNMINKIAGKKSPIEIHHLKSGDNEITSLSEIAEKLGETFCENSSSHSSTVNFQNHRAKAERQHLKFKSNNKETYNELFTIQELSDAINKSKDSAVGPDNIHYQMLKHLSEPALSSLLGILNNTWVTGNFPDSWRQANIIPIPKPNKDKSDPSSYRPIALTSCICKVMERMVNSRLVWYLEKRKLITPMQSGFRKGRCTTDQLLRLETFIRESFINRQHVTAIFFDLEKAYDTTWKYGIMKDLHEAGLRGRLPEFIGGFLQDRQFCVRLGSTYSKEFSQEMGVPQGCILSVTLFCLKINSIVKCISPGVECSLYVDDFLICYRSKYTHIAERHLQQCLNKLQHWADTNGFKFSPSKTVCVHFCRLRKPHPDPVLTLNGTPIPVVEQTKFLGVIFDSKLSFIPHIRYLKDKCMKAINLLKVLSNTSWGADQQTLLHLYRSLIRSKLDYGCIVYGSARPSYLKILDPIENCALRLCLGAFRTSPATSLCVEANEPPLDIRRKRLSLQYVARLASNPSNPAHNVAFKPQFKAQFNKKPSQTATFGIRMAPDIKTLGLVGKNVALWSIPTVPPWTLHRPIVNLDLHRYSKSDTSPELFRAKFNEIRDGFSGYSEFFTDGSKDGTKASSAVIYQNKSRSTRLSDGASIFTAELYAILTALSWIHKTATRQFVIYSDSLSSLVAIKHFKLENEILYRIMKSYSDICSTGKLVIFCWIPSHVGISGNEKADAEAKSALLKHITKIKLPSNDFMPSIKFHCNNLWQQSWDTCVSNKLHSIQPVICQTKCIISKRRDAVILSRLRIGHTRLTHSYLLSRDDVPECETCQLPLTVQHILIDCKEYTSVRERHFSAQTLSELLQPSHSQLVLNFIKDIGLFDQI